MRQTARRSPAPADPAARFAKRLARLWPEGGRIGLAVSGGADSLALLLLAQKAIPHRFAVATVDHGLRAEAAAECAGVAQVCAARGIACEVLTVTVAPGNVQDRARHARYAALSDWLIRHDLCALATAHHADDQAETLLMRLNRASGTGGLAGVRERGRVPGSEIPLLRPLLGFRRTELEAIVSAAALDPVRDPSNADERFDRVQIRQALADADWLDPAALARSAAHLAEAEDALDWAAAREWAENVACTEETIRYRPAAPNAIALRIAARAMARFGATPRGSELARLVERLHAGEGGNVAGVMVRPEGDAWLFCREPARRTG
ncbi:tRNA lysidine(34) synthetase TilS [Altericroceibacterium xinjiangense]|uniref:tRNA lysidine(34) synthetase TilS n=1 Tax=Altericroceibacterium xinjiangense TaxID=762261 RepID=UPI000F7F17CB|nr:tRNA lysidine(34) synthetase TilS [Altericroceibacterium xinjiangense]